MHAKFLKKKLYVLQKLAACWVAMITTNDYTCGGGQGLTGIPPRYLIMINKSITHTLFMIRIISLIQINIARGKGGVGVHGIKKVRFSIIFVKAYQDFVHDCSTFGVACK